jgi:hypothetical protein
VFPPIDLAQTIKHRWAISDKQTHKALPCRIANYGGRSAASSSQPDYRRRRGAASTCSTHARAFAATPG